MLYTFYIITICFIYCVKFFSKIQTYVLLFSLNGSLNIKFETLNPNGIAKNFYRKADCGSTAGWIRFFKLSYINTTIAMGSCYDAFNVTINQFYNNGQGGICNLDIIKDYPDSCYITQRYNTLGYIKKFRVVRNGKDVYFDFYSSGIDNNTFVIINIPYSYYLDDASIVKYLVVPDVSDEEKIIKSIDLVRP